MHLHTVTALGVVLAAALTPAGAETVYRYLDASGQVVYSESVPEGVEAEVIELAPAPPGETPESLRERVERQLEVAEELEAARRRREAERAEQRAPEPLPAPVEAPEPRYLIPYLPPHWGRPPHHRPPEPRPEDPPPEPSAPPARPRGAVD